MHSPRPRAMTTPANTWVPWAIQAGRVCDAGAGGGGSTLPIGSAGALRVRSGPPHEEHGEQHDERQRGPQPGAQHAVGREEPGQLGLEDAQADAAEERQRDARQVADDAGGDGGDEQREEVEAVELREERGDEDAGQAGQHARQDPREQRHPLRVDALQLQEAGALDDGSHLQAHASRGGTSRRGRSRRGR